MLCSHISQTGRAHEYHIETGVNKFLAVISDTAFQNFEVVRLAVTYLLATQKRFYFSLNKLILSRETTFDMKSTKKRLS